MVQVMQWQPLSVYKHRSFGVKHPPFWQIWVFRSDLLGTPAEATNENRNF